MTDDTLNGNNLEPDLDILSLYTGERNVRLQNWDAVNQLDREADLLAKSVLSSFGASAVLTLISALNFGLFLVIGGLTTVFLNKEYLWRIRRLSAVAKLILNHYGADNVVVTPRVDTDSATIDLLVRMHDKKMYALAIRCNENVGVLWREDRQEFFTVRKGKSPKKADSLTKAINSLQSISYLKKIKDSVMGKTSSERSAPLIKAIVLAPGAKIVARGDSPLWVEFGEAKVLKIQTTSITYVVECNDLVKFLEPTKK
jgi:hypothetical protein